MSLEFSWGGQRGVTVLWAAVFPDKSPHFVRSWRDAIEWHVVPQRPRGRIRIIHYVRRYAEFHCRSSLLVIPWPSETRLAGVARASKVDPRLLNALHHSFAVPIPACEQNGIQIVYHSKHERHLHAVTRVELFVRGCGAISEQIHIGRLLSAVAFRQSDRGNPHQKIPKQVDHRIVVVQVSFAVGFDGFVCAGAGDFSHLLGEQILWLLADRQIIKGGPEADFILIGPEEHGDGWRPPGGDRSHRHFLDHHAVEGGAERGICKGCLEQFLLRFPHLHHTQLLEVLDSVDSSELHIGSGHFESSGLVAHFLRGPAFQDRLMKKALRGRRHDQNACAACPRRLSKQRHIIGVSAEGRYILSHPFERRNLIENAKVASFCVVLPSYLSQFKEAPRANPVLQSYDHDIPTCCEHRAVVPRVSCAPFNEPTAVDPHHYRTLLEVGLRRPNIHRQTILCHHRVVVLSRINVYKLRASWSEIQRWTNVCPRGWSDWRAESQMAYRRRREPNSPKNQNAFLRFTTYGTSSGLDHNSACPFGFDCRYRVRKNSAQCQQSQTFQSYVGRRPPNTESLCSLGSLHFASPPGRNFVRSYKTKLRLSRSEPGRPSAQGKIDNLRIVDFSAVVLYIPPILA